MADQPQLEFNNLPTEALFSFFFALDPLTIGKARVENNSFILKNRCRHAKNEIIII